MEDIIIVNEKEFFEKKKRFLESGSERIHILADFDRTLTKAFYKQKKASAIIQHLRLEKGRYLTEDYAERSHALFDQYHPIEIDPKIPMNERVEKMVEWWKAHMDLLIECGLDKTTIKKCIEDTISEDTLCFREGVEDFLSRLKRENVPLVIITSSLGDLIDEFLSQQNKKSDNVHVIGNRFNFDSKGKAINIEKIVHIFNKNEFSTEGLGVHKKLLERKNVILLGDHLGDLGMVDGFPYDDLIKISFLNENIQGNLEGYKEAYDVVILNDGNFDFVNKLTKELISKKQWGTAP